MNVDPETARLKEACKAGVPWRKWGPYLSERQWGTVREDYSHDGNAWNYFTHDQARSRAYHWGEDGLAGLSDDRQLPLFRPRLWNGKDPILKERLFGLTNSEGNHGEDVKEYYFYLDNIPTHSYMKYLYKYPQAAFPYDDLVRTNHARNRPIMEYELLDTGIFDNDRYFDVFVEYAKNTPEDILIQISVCNRGPEDGRAACLADFVVSQYLDMVAGYAEASLAASRGNKRQLGSWPQRTLNWGTGTFTARETHRFYSPRTRRITSESSARRIPARMLKTASTTTWYPVEKKRSTRDTGVRKPPPIIKSQSTPERPLQSGCGLAIGPLKNWVNRSGSNLRSRFESPHPRRKSSIGSITPEACGRRQSQRHASGLGRHALEQAIFRFRCGEMARGARRRSNARRTLRTCGTANGFTW